MIIKCCAISDTHKLHNQLTIEECDILFHSGDFTGTGGNQASEDFFTWLERQPATFKVFIAGNHERGYEKKNGWLQDRLANLKNGTYYLEDSGIDLFGIKIWGCPWQPEFHSWEFNLPRGRELREKYDLIPPDTDILLSHGPPYGVEDYIPLSYMRPFEQDNRVGCKDLELKIKDLELKYHIFGHIHLDDRKEIQARSITSKKDNTLCINASVVNNQYHLYAKPYYFNYEL